MNFIFSRSILFAILISLSACSATHSAQSGPTATPHSTDTPIATEGGVDGGGGGTLPAQPISIYDVQEVVRSAKQTLDSYIKFKLRTFRPQHALSYEVKIFTGAVTIWDVLQNTDLELSLNQPCYDSHHHAVDGSVYATQPNAICISAFRIAPKLIKERAQTEILSLILHELSHKLATTEAEAQAFQKDAAFDLGPLIAKTSSKDFAQKAQILSEKVSNLLFGLAGQLNSITASELNTQMTLIQSSLLDFQSSIQTIPFSIFDRFEHDYYLLQADQFRLALWSALSLAGEPKEMAYAKSQLDKVFEGSESVTEHEFQMRFSGSDSFPSVYGNEKLRRLHSRNELNHVIVSFRDMFSITSQAIRNLWLNSQMGPMPVLEKTANPWAAFVGNYEATSESCTRPQDVTHILSYSVAPDANDNGQLRLQKNWPNSRGDFGGLYNGAIPPSGQTAVHVEGAADSAKRIAEFGGRWQNQFHQVTIEIKKTQTDYVMVETSTGHSYSTGPVDEKSSCTMKLKRTNN